MPEFSTHYPFVKTFRFALVAVLSLASVLMNVGRSDAGPRDDVLYWSTGAEFENISPYYDFRPEVEIFSHLIWDRLFHREPNFLCST